MKYSYLFPEHILEMYFCFAGSIKRSKQTRIFHFITLETLPISGEIHHDHDCLKQKAMPW